MSGERIEHHIPTSDIFCSICRTHFNKNDIDLMSGTINFVKTICNHIFCNDCWTRYERLNSSILTCPYCRNQLSDDPSPIPCDDLIEFTILSDMERFVIWFNTHIPAELRTTPEADILKQRIISKIESGEKFNHIICPQNGEIIRDESDICYHPIVIQTYIDYMWKTKEQSKIMFPLDQITPTYSQMSISDGLIHKELPPDTLCSDTGERIGYGSRYAICSNCNAYYLYKNIHFVLRYNHIDKLYHVNRKKCTKCDEPIYPIHKDNTIFGRKYNEAYRNYKKCLQIMDNAKKNNTYKHEMKCNYEEAYSIFLDMDKEARTNIRKNLEKFKPVEIKMAEDIKSLSPELQSSKLIETFVNAGAMQHYGKHFYELIDEPFFLNTPPLPPRYGYEYMIPSRIIKNFAYQDITIENNRLENLLEYGISWMPLPDTITEFNKEVITVKPYFLATREAKIWREVLIDSRLKFGLITKAVQYIAEVFNYENTDLNHQMVSGAHWSGNVNIEDFSANGNWGTFIGPLISSHCSPMKPNCREVANFTEDRRFMLYLSEQGFQYKSDTRPNNCNDCGCKTSYNYSVSLWDRDMDWKFILTSKCKVLDFIHPDCNETLKLNIVNADKIAQFDILSSLIEEDPKSDFITGYIMKSKKSGYNINVLWLLIDIHKDQLSAAKTEEQKTRIKNYIQQREEEYLSYL